MQLSGISPAPCICIEGYAKEEESTNCISCGDNCA